MDAINVRNVEPRKELGKSPLLLKNNYVQNVLTRIVISQNEEAWSKTRR